MYIVKDELISEEKVYKELENNCRRCNYQGFKPDLLKDVKQIYENFY